MSEIYGACANVTMMSSDVDGHYAPEVEYEMCEYSRTKEGALKELNDRYESSCPWYLAFGLTTCGAEKVSYKKVNIDKVAWLKPFLKFVG